LIVFSHGGLSVNTSNISLYQELSSHGYVVASIGHTYHALIANIGSKAVFVNPGYMNELNADNSHTHIENSYTLFQKWMDVRTGDMNFVIDTLTGKIGTETDSFYPLIDAGNIGVAGHSLGGSAAIGVVRQRDDIKAAIVLDAPFMCDITGVYGEGFTWNTEPYSCAIMNIYSDSIYPSLVESDNKYVQNNNYLYNRENVEYYHIEGSNHYSLTDLSRTSPILCALLGGYYNNGYAALAYINEKSVAFFDKYLKAESR
jgi:predicted dienelactone hydrolase